MRQRCNEPGRSRMDRQLQRLLLYDGGNRNIQAFGGDNPYIGTTGNLEKVDEYRIETVVSQRNLKKVIEAMIKVHPYEEVAYDVYPLEIKGRQYGMGNVGVLDKPKSLDEFIAVVKEKLGVKNVRVIGETNKEIEKVAVFCGSFDRDVMEAAKSKADVLVTRRRKISRCRRYVGNRNVCYRCRTF